MLNHRRDDLGEMVGHLRRTGYDVTESRSLDASQRLTESGSFDLAILNPLVLRRQGVEFGLLEALHRRGPISVLVLVDSPDGLEEARHLAVPLRDFVMPPHSIDEILHRVELAAAALDHVNGLHELARELQGQVTNDFKTELLSEQHFRNLLHVEFKRAQRNQDPLSLLLIDVDNFKTINDTTDYAFGDEVLRTVAATLKSSCRETDFAARFGGDEFAVLLPQTTPAEAVQTGLRIRQRVAERVIKSDRYSTRVTISLGIDTYDGQSATTPDDLRFRANKALHEAKQRGKDQVWLYSDDDNGDDDVLPPLPSRSR